MEFISVEEFLKQPKEIQKVFLDWWLDDFSFGNIFYHNYYQRCIAFEKWINSLNCISSSVEEEHDIPFDEIIPLFTEGQIRKFIEDKTGFKIQEIKFEHGYKICTTYKTIDNYKDIWLHDELGTDLLQAYWKVACEIAKEEME